MIELTQEPPGLPFIELCVSCRKPTRLWAEEGTTPLCRSCAKTLTPKQYEALSAVNYLKIMQILRG